MKIQKRRYELTDDEWERICSSLFEEQGQMDVPTMIFEQLSMASLLNFKRNSRFHMNSIGRMIT